MMQVTLLLSSEKRLLSTGSFMKEFDLGDKNLDYLLFIQAELAYQHAHEDIILI